MIFKLILASLLGWASLAPIRALSEPDPFNTYQYNRQNYLQKNGQIDTSPWFEWWYYKVVLPEKNKSFYFVYGVVNPWDLTETHSSSRSYVGMGAFANNLTLEQNFRVHDFSASYTSTEVHVGDNQATDTFIRGKILSNKGHEAYWKMSIAKQWAFDATVGATGKNITNIEWYPAQADARCSGEIVVDGILELFENAPCYQDRNWGSLFPDWWAWIVSNHFENSPGTSLVIGGGKPTFVDRYKGVEGVIVGLKHKDKEYSWRPYKREPVRFNISMGTWEIDAINKNHRIQISASAPREKFMDLQFTTPQGEVFHDYEALQGDLRLRLYERSGIQWKLIEDLISHQAGLEYGSYKEFQSKSLN